MPTGNLRRKTPLLVKLIRMAYFWLVGDLSFVNQKNWRGRFLFMPNLEKQCACDTSACSGPRMVDTPLGPMEFDLVCDRCNKPYHVPIEERIRGPISQADFDSIYYSIDDRPDPRKQLQS